MKEKLLIVLSVLAFFLGLTLSYKREKKHAPIRERLIREHKIIIN